MGWDKELEELRHREALAEQMGGADKVARQHGRGKMDARARLAALCDDGTFREIGKIAGRGSYDEDGNLTGVLPAPFLFGKALVNGRPVLACNTLTKDLPDTIRLQPLPVFDGNHAVVGSWVIEGKAAGVGMREDERRITHNNSRFVPHYFR